MSREDTLAIETTQTAELAPPQTRPYWTPFYVDNKLCKTTLASPIENSGVMKLRRIFRVTIKTRSFSELLELLDLKIDPKNMFEFSCLQNHC